jgi:hypothetical protein
MELECPECKGHFILSAPQEQAVAQMAQPQPLQQPGKPMFNRDLSNSYDPPASNFAGSLIKLLLRIFIVILLIAGGIWALIKFLTITPESLDGNQLYVMTQKRENRDGIYGLEAIAKHDFFPVAANKEDFFYRNATLIGLNVSSADNEYYKGLIFFVRNGKKMQRPLIIDRRYSFCRYHFPVDYAENPEYLEEDGDLIFELAAAIGKDLKGWKYQSGKVISDNILECIISKNGKKKKIELKATTVDCEDKISRIWVEIL